MKVPIRNGSEFGQNYNEFCLSSLKRIIFNGLKDKRSSNLVIPFLLMQVSVKCQLIYVIITIISFRKSDSLRFYCLLIVICGGKCNP